MVALYLQSYDCIMIIRRDVFQAIADPTRREIINAIAEDFKVSRQAISKHIQILEECGLVVITPKGRERFCEVRPAKLNEVVEWVEQSQKQWVSRFKKLDNYLNQSKNKDDERA